MARLNYVEVGIRDVGDGLVEFEVLPEYVEEIKSAYLGWDDESKTASFTCSPQAAVALQIFLRTGKLRAVKFRSPKFQQDWKEYRPKKVKTDEDRSTDVPDTAEAPEPDYAF